MKMNLTSGNMLSDFYYSIATKGFITAAKLISPLNARAKALIDSRKTEIKPPAKKKNEIRLWLHVASLGEFEQARPVLEILKFEIPNLTIFTSFYSPSGYENRHNDSLIDYAFYLPFDSKKSAKQLIAKINPDFAIWVKYDFWIHYLNELYKHKIPCFLIAALFRENQIYFKKVGENFIDVFKKFESISCQNKESAALLSKFGIKKVEVNGDPRIDNVIKLKSRNNQLPIIQQFKGEHKLIVIGSAYKIEIETIVEFLNENPQLKCIVAPHFVDSININEISKLIPNSTLYSNFERNQNGNFQTLIIDSIGKLAMTYQYANFAFIGGGFSNGGLHNILEAIVHGIPICFGPKISRFPEAVQLIDLNLANIVSNKQEFNLWLNTFIQNKIKQENRNQELENWMNENSGAAARTAADILKRIKKKN
jgi:3-deoxy-D-manno-octulosonic-acid transferase